MCSRLDSTTIELIFGDGEHSIHADRERLREQSEYFDRALSKKWQKSLPVLRFPSGNRDMWKVMIECASAKKIRCVVLLVSS
jgi:hypothetical protein